MREGTDFTESQISVPLERPARRATVPLLDEGHNARWDNTKKWTLRDILVPVVLCVVYVQVAFDKRTIGDFLDLALEDDRFDSILRTRHAMRVGDQVLCLHTFATRAEHEFIVEPASPDRHRVRAAVGANRANPIVVCSPQTLDRPTPRQKSTTARVGHHIVAGGKPREARPRLGSVLPRIHLDQVHITPDGQSMSKV